uniref:Cmp-sialic acid transporter 1-like n=2 Tax=Tetraselmis sp. GSL018 TaxID=582737 RepID=A0A061R2A2_9CHLO|mmetsp:Transcript_22125/g.52898  ORF Transcript_22125/g.52898 Transcript_22125/m.52898 type:complete len:332 (+) Transcript_22125:299-1294(+)
MVSKGTQTLIFAVVLTLATSSQGIFTTASKVDGKYLYNFATVPLLAEAVKLTVSFYFLLRLKWCGETVKMTRNWKTWALFPVPSIIYVIHNNVQFYMLKYVNPSTYQILGNLKIITTGLLFRLLLGRRLTVLQWIALVLLMVGATTSQVQTDCGGAEATFSAPLEGYLFGLFSAFLSALAAVYTEWVMKKNDDCLYWQNIQLYTFGVIFNAVKLTLDDINVSFSNGLWVDKVFVNYNTATYFVVANLAFSGLLVSWIMKFADSIVKVYSTSMAMLVTMLFSVWLFHLRPSLQLVLGIFCASSSLQLYYMRPSDLAISSSKGHQSGILPTRA